jgi:taurine dioxygenase
MEATQRQSNANPNLPAQLQVIPSGVALGAEIRGIDLSQPVPEATRELLRKAWADHLVLFWRGQMLPDESLLAPDVDQQSR